MKWIQSFKTTAIMDAKHRFMRRSLILIKQLRSCKNPVDEAVGKRIWKASKIRYVVRNELH